MVKKRAKKSSSTNPLIIIAVMAIALSLFSLFLSVAKMSVTGAALDTGEGYVNVTVLTAVDMTIWIKSINFTNTLVGDTRTSYAHTNVSTTDNVPCNVDNHCGMNISNEGSAFINISIRETERLWTSDLSIHNNEKYFLYNVTMQDPDYVTGYNGKGDCSVGYAGGLKGPDDNGEVGQWRRVPSMEWVEDPDVAICYLNHTHHETEDDSDSRPDIARVEFNITVPLTERTGEKTATITFVASLAEELV